jgi:hypothetical protein
VPKHKVRRRAQRTAGTSFGTASHFTATGFSGKSRPRRLKIAEPSGCESRVADQISLVELWLGKPACGLPGREDRFDSKPNSLGSASLPTPTIWNVNRASEPGLGANECMPSGRWCRSTAFRHSNAAGRIEVAEVPETLFSSAAPVETFRARSSKRAGGLIPRIALDECRVPERYRTRVPNRTLEREVDRAARSFRFLTRLWKEPGVSR